MRRMFAVLVLLVAGCPARSVTAGEWELPEDKSKFHIFLFAGQSNMAGGFNGSHLYDDEGNYDPLTKPLPRVLQYKRGGWVPAAHPTTKHVKPMRRSCTAWFGMCAGMWAIRIFRLSREPSILNGHTTIPTAFLQRCRPIPKPRTLVRPMKRRSRQVTCWRTLTCSTRRRTCSRRAPVISEDTSGSWSMRTAN